VRSSGYSFRDDKADAIDASGSVGQGAKMENVGGHDFILGPSQVTPY